MIKINPEMKEPMWKSCIAVKCAFQCSAWLYLFDFISKKRFEIINNKIRDWLAAEGYSLEDIYVVMYGCKRKNRKLIIRELGK